MPRRRIGVKSEDAIESDSATSSVLKYVVLDESVASELSIRTYFKFQGAVFLVADAGDSVGDAPTLILLHRIGSDLATEAYRCQG